MSDKITIVGESNPYGADPYYALYPAPDGCSGHRLCVLVLGMNRTDYLETFDRVNLVAGSWSIRAARKTAAQLGGRLILLGSKVSSAFGLPFTPLQVLDDKLILPHPSGLCRIWAQPGMYEQARKRVAAFAPELAALLGKRDRKTDAEAVPAADAVQDFVKSVDRLFTALGPDSQKGLFGDIPLGKIKAPFTPEQVHALNRFQQDGRFHPFTCGSGRRTDAEHLDGEGVLVATTQGWKCPYCNYTQDWAHAMMAGPLPAKGAPHA